MNLETVIALNRFGLGARPGELAEIDGRHERWLKELWAWERRTWMVGGIAIDWTSSSRES